MSAPQRTTAPRPVDVEPAATSHTAPTSHTAATSRTATVTQRWRRARLPIALGALVLLGSLVVTLVSRSAPEGFLDPEAVDDAGSRALVQLLADQGVSTVDARSVDAALDAAGPGTTLLVALPRELSGDRLRALGATGADVVLVDPGPNVDTLAALSASGRAAVRDRDPGCGLRAARTAGSVRIGGTRYAAESTDGVDVCYGPVSGASLVRAPGTGDTSGTVTALGDPDVLTNAGIVEPGAAALAMGLLGEHDTLVWYLPQDGPIGDAPGDASLTSLIPAPWTWAAIQAAIAVLLVMVWRGRRLGRVVSEPLPVIVRAAESTEGRARLYARSRDRAHAAEALRDATRSRLRPLLGHGGTADRLDRGALVDTAATRSGRHPAVVGSLLYGPPPEDDAALVALAQALDTLEVEVRRS